MQKIHGFRAFYETLGKAYPADSTVNINEATIAGVKTYWLNENLIGQKEVDPILNKEFLNSHALM